MPTEPGLYLHRTEWGEDEHVIVRRFVHPDTGEVIWTGESDMGVKPLDFYDGEWFRLS